MLRRILRLAAVGVTLMLASCSGLYVATPLDSTGVHTTQS